MSRKAKMVKSGVSVSAFPNLCCDEKKSFQASLWLQVSELFSACALLSAVMRAQAWWVDKVLSSASAGIAAEALSAVQARPAL